MATLGAHRVRHNAREWDRAAGLRGQCNIPRVFAMSRQEEARSAYVRWMCAEEAASWMSSAVPEHPQRFIIALSEDMATTERAFSTSFAAGACMDTTQLDARPAYVEQTVMVIFKNCLI